MRRGNAHPDRNIPDGQVADAVYADRLPQTEFFFGLFENALPFNQRQRLIGFVFERGNFVPFVMVAHPALKRDQRPAGRIFGMPFQLLRIQRI